MAMQNKKSFIVLLIKCLPLLTLLGLALPAKGGPATVSVKDAQTRLPIPFALVSNGGRVTLTDAMGLLASQGNSLSISAFGYQSQEVTLNGEDSLHVYLQPIAHRESTTDDIHAREVAMTLGAKHTPPPPHRAVAHSRAVGYKRIKKTKWQGYTLESLPSPLNDWYYVYSSELITKRNNSSNSPQLDEIIAYRQDGYPWYSQFALQVRQFSAELWNNPIVVSKMPFVSPFHHAQSQLYTYTIVDTLRDGQGQTLLRIAFAPRKANRDKLLEGEFIVNANDYRPLYIIMRPSLQDKASARFTIWQRYAMTELGHWQPVEQAMYANVGLSALKTRLFVITEYSNFTREGTPASASLPTLSPLDPSTLPERTMRATSALSQQRRIGDTPHKIDSYFKFRYPLRYINIPVFSLIDFGKVEGPRVGLAIETSDRLSSIVQLEGYYAYGIRDKQHKYGGFLRFNILPRHDLQLQLGYTHDAVMPGDMIRKDRNGRYLLSDYLYNMSAPMLDYRDDYRLTLSARVHRGLNLFVEGAYSTYANKPGMGFKIREHDGSFSPGASPYSLISGKAEVRWVPFQRLAVYNGGSKVVEENNPLARLTYTVACDAGNMARVFHKIETSLFSYASSPIWGSYMLTLRGGATLGDNPLADGYFNSGTSGGVFGVTFKQIFYTVPIGFAYRDYYVDLQAQYDFAPWVALKLLDSWELSPLISFNAGWGGVRENYNWGTTNPPVDMGKGLFEVGLGIAGLIPNSIYPPLRPSINGFYRVGAYADSNPNKNWSIILSFLLGL